MRINNCDLKDCGFLCFKGKWEYVSPKDYQKDRRMPTQNERKILLEEVNGLCPMVGCGKSLMNEKNGRIYEDFEVAHIFLNNFKNDMEAIILADVEVDGDSSESLENWMALCHDCHSKYDELKTVASYQQMLDLKRRLAAELKAKKTIAGERIEEDLDKAIKSLVKLDKSELEKAGKLGYEAMAVREKIPDDEVLCSNIEDKVTRYFNYIRVQFKQQDPNGDHFDLICTSVKKVYLMLKVSNLSKSDIFEKITDWFVSKTQVPRLVCEIMTSFFVQNCDVYEVSK